MKKLTEDTEIRFGERLLAQLEAKGRASIEEIRVLALDYPGLADALWEMPDLATVCERGGARIRDGALWVRIPLGEPQCDLQGNR